jgi:ERCC4-type nuclease
MATETELTFPALRGLGELANTKPVICIDSREQQPLVFTRLRSVVGTLQSGDYTVVGLGELFAVERKTVSDLVGCCIGENRERFERELHRLRGFRFKRLLIVGSELEIQSGTYMSRIRPQSVFGSLEAWQARYDRRSFFDSLPNSLRARWSAGRSTSPGNISEPATNC